MSANITRVNQEFDKEIVDIVDYVVDYEVTSDLA